jgi:hypothetical protein
VKEKYALMIEQCIRRKLLIIFKRMLDRHPIYANWYYRKVQNHLLQHEVLTLNDTVILFHVGKNYQIIIIQEI